MGSDRYNEAKNEQPAPTTQKEPDFKVACNHLRSQIGVTGKLVRQLMGHSKFSVPPHDGMDPGEMKANIMLAYRHLEDARMRLGKAIQSLEGGVSVFDK